LTPVLASVILVSPLTVRVDDCSTEDGTSAEDVKLALCEVIVWFTFDGRCRVMACDVEGVEFDEVI
jgi:hypothetical protein